MRLTPKGHQVREANYLTSLPGKRGLLLSETGTGKTITLGLVAQSMNEPCLWLTEKSLTTQTQRELHALGVAAAQLGSKQERTDDPQVIVATHGLARTRLDELLNRGPWPLLVVDEAQALGGGGTSPRHATYQAVKALSKDAGLAIGSTAEPVATCHLLDLWAIGDALNVPGWLSRQRIGQYVLWQEYAQHIGNRVITHLQPDGISEAGIRLLFGNVARIGIRTPLDEVAEGIPAVERHQHPVPLTHHALTAYSSVDAGGLTGHQQHTAISRDDQALIPYVLNLLTDTYREHESVVLYTERFDLLEPLALSLTKAGLEPVRITGRESAKDRQHSLDLHRTGRVRCLIGTKALEAGLNVQHASLLISVVQSYNPAREKQREGRLRRLGSPHPRIVHGIVFPDVPLERRRQWVLERKHALAQRLFTHLAESRQQP